MVAIKSNNVGHFDNGLTHSLCLCLDKIILSMHHKLPVSRSKFSKTVAVLSYEPNGNYWCTNLLFSQYMKDSLVGTHIQLSVQNKLACGRLRELNSGILGSSLESSVVVNVVNKAACNRSSTVLLYPSNSHLAVTKQGFCVSEIADNTIQVRCPFISHYTQPIISNYMSFQDLILPYSHSK